MEIYWPATAVHDRRGDSCDTAGDVRNPCVVHVVRDGGAPMPAVPAPIDLPPAQVGAAVEVLALAFQNDPISRYVLPDETHRSRVLRWMFQSHLRYGQRYGVIATTAAL